MSICYLSEVLPDLVLADEPDPEVALCALEALVHVVGEDLLGSLLVLRVEVLLDVVLRVELLQADLAGVRLAGRGEQGRDQLLNMQIQLG